MAKSKQTKEAKIEMFKAKLDRWWEEDSTARKKIDWQWFIYDLWKEGHHYARYDKGQQQILTNPKSDGKPKVTINKIDPAIRAVVNYALRNRPKAEVTPSGATRDNMEEILRQNLFLDYMHDHLGLRQIERGVVEESVASGISWVQILWDEDAADGQGEIKVNEIDKYDLYWQKGARTPEESRRFTIAVSRSIEELKTDPKYKNANWDNVKADNQRSSSSLKERLLRLDSGDTTSAAGSNDSGTVLLKEFWYYGDKDQGEDSEKIYVCAKAGTEIIRPSEETDLDRMNFFRLCAQRRKLQMVGKSWIKNLIPLNKRLNSLMSSLAEYNVTMNKVVLVADKGAGVRTFKNEHALVYEKKRGFNIESTSPGQPSAMIIQEIQYILQLFEDISAVHDATMGRIPTGAKSGKALEALQVGDSNNLSEVVENTEIWLEEVYEYILSLAATKYQFARDVTPTTRTGQKEFLKVIGEDATQAAPEEGSEMGAPVNPLGATVIKKKNVVDVKISSYLAHTAEARREAIGELASVMASTGTPLDPQTILEVYEVGPIADVIARMKENQDAQQVNQLAMQGAQNAMNQPPQAGAQEAIAVIRLILNGQAPQLPQSVSPEFIAYFDKFIQESQQQGDVDPKILQLLQKVRDQLAASAGGMATGMGASQPLPSGGQSPTNTPGAPTTS